MASDRIDPGKFRQLRSLLESGRNDALPFMNFDEILLLLFLGAIVLILIGAAFLRR